MNKVIQLSEEPNEFAAAVAFQVPNTVRKPKPWHPQWVRVTKWN